MLSLKKIGLGTLVIVATQACCNTWAARPYLDDANKTYPANSGAPSFNHHLFPRTLDHEINKKTSNEALSKYHFIDVHGHGFFNLEDIQSYLSPETMALRHISGREYSSFNGKFCYITSGVAFESTGPISQGGPQSAGCDIYPGHWLYKTGTKLTQSANGTTLTLKLTDASKVEVGKYVVIYDAPAGSFNNAEHVKVKSRDLSNNTISLQARGYKSKASPHASGSIVAQHVRGNGTDNRLWAFNFSTKSPKDGNNKTFGNFYADWLQKNWNKVRTGVKTTANVAGILFDTDFYFDEASRKVDANNDLIQDDGVSSTGVNWLGAGLDDFYRMVRARLPNQYVLAGVHDARGFESTHGAQMENWLDYGNGDFKANPKYIKLNQMFAHYLFSMSERSWGKPLTHNLNKTATKLYPGIATPAPTSNAPFRLGLALTLMDDGYFGTHSLHTPDAWWDEYAVDVTPGSANFGNAIDKNDVSAVRQHRGWLGRPLAPFTRIYDDTKFAPSKSLLNDGSFDANLGLWKSDNVTIKRVTSGQLEGSGALSASIMSNYSVNPSGAKIKSENVNIINGQEYTVAFSAKASQYRDIEVALGDSSGRSQKIPLGTKWRRYVLTFVATKNETRPLKFSVGRENSKIWLDSVHVFRGNANVFRRDFDNGIAVANATPVSRTIDLGGNFQRILGTQDSAINNGLTVSSVTLPPYDGLVLVRTDGGGSNTPPPPSNNTDSAEIGDFVWNDANGDGIQNNSESGLAGVTVQLRSCQNTILDTVVTDSNGAYTFTNLAAGDYRIKFKVPAGMTISPPRKGTSRGLDSNPDPANGLTDCLYSSVDQVRNGIDAGMVPEATGGSGSIGDFVWRDANGNGIQNNSESGLAGVTVQLRSCQNTILDTVVTDSNGAYTFTNLAAGDYRIKFKVPAGMTISPPRKGTSRGLDSNPDPANGLTDCIYNSVDQVRNGIDAGMVP